VKRIAYVRLVRQHLRATHDDSIVQRAFAAARQITADYNLIEGNWRDADFLLIAFTMSAGGRCGDTLRV
jgi:hypothetical protein